MPDVTIIIPCYNQGHYLSDAMDSVLSQTHSDWEAIIVDDGSLDNTKGISDSYKDHRIHYYRQENQGLAAARNTGIRAASGSYLSFLDADDRWSSEFIEKCLEKLKEEPDLAGVYTANRFIDRSGKVLPQVNSSKPVPHDELRRRLWEGGFFPPCAILFRKDPVIKVGLFDTKLAGQGYEDWDLLLRIVMHHPLGCISEPLAEYRIHDASMSNNAESMHRNRMDILRKHLGPETGEPSTWPDDKQRAYSFAYRSTAMGHLLQHNQEASLHYLGKAARCWAPIFTRLDTYFELVYSDFPQGYRADPNALDIDAICSRLEELLEKFFAEDGEVVNISIKQALSKIFLVLAILSEEAGDWHQARYYIRQSAWIHPVQLRDKYVVRRIVKLHLGKSIIRAIGQSISSYC